MRSSSRARWMIAPRALARRFVLALLVLRFLPFPIGGLPGTGSLADLLERARGVMVQELSLRVLGHAVDAQFNGSGDTRYEYLSLGCDVALALAVACAWPLGVRRWPALARASRAVRPYLRLALAATLLGYGMVKVLPIQFGRPSWTILSQTYGDSSPMRLLWTFMSASRPYTVASGAAEVLAGLLLLFGWTTGLGALLAVGVMSNVVLLNLCYDVPVKIGSITYLVASLVLLAPDAARVGRALWARRTPLAWGDRRAMLVTLGHALAIGTILYVSVIGRLGSLLGPAEQEPFAGFYEVTCHDGPAGSPGWRNVEISPHFVQTRFADGRGVLFRCGAADGAGTREATRVNADGTRESMPLSITREADGSVTLRVGAGETAQRACLRPASPPQFLLTARGFHWINEFPFNL